MPLDKRAIDYITERRDTALSDGERQALDVIYGNLERGYTMGGPFERRASMQSWEETLVNMIADGVQVLNTTTESVMVPNFQLPANYLYPGRSLKWTVWFDVSTVITTPGTITFRLRYGTNALPASNTQLAVSGAFAPDTAAASTNVTGVIEWWFVARAAGATASSYTMGRVELTDFVTTSVATLITGLDMRRIPQSAPAAVNIDTTAASFLQPSVAFSVATATTQLTSHIGILEALT